MSTAEVALPSDPATSTAAPRPAPAADAFRLNAKRTRAMFATPVLSLPEEDDTEAVRRIRLSSKFRDEFEHVSTLPAAVKAQQAKQAKKSKTAKKATTVTVTDDTDNDSANSKLINDLSTPRQGGSSYANGGVVALRTQGSAQSSGALIPSGGLNSSMVRKPFVQQVRPDWHAPWKLMRVISGHQGWVRALAVEPDNKWFATGAGDRTIKIWDLASGTLKLSLTGHISTVRGLAVSPRHPYLFSCGEDKMVKCWDLEYNKVIRHYHGHLSGVYSLSLHPTLDVLVTAGRDATARVWDMRTKQQVFTLSGHDATIADVKCQEADPQVITASMDSTIRLWDLAAGKTMATLTHHKKSVRALAIHPRQFTFASASADNLKMWKCPKGDFIRNLEGHRAIVNTLAVNEDNVLFSGADNGSIRMWDYKTGHCFQTMDTVVQPGSLDSEAGIFTSTFDHTGLRLITGEADKTIKIYKEDEEATQETHPLNWKPTLTRARY